VASDERTVLLERVRRGAIVLDEGCWAGAVRLHWYTFRYLLARSKAGEKFVSFIPAVSDDAAKATRRRVRRWRLHFVERAGSR
jgi:hypothetical protein